MTASRLKTVVVVIRRSSVLSVFTTTRKMI